MGDHMRWHYGETNPVTAAVNSATVIEVGDLVFQETDDARPASDSPDQGSFEANQEWFTKNFLGVAMQRSRAGETSPIRVATTGVFEFDCPANTFELGDFIGTDKNNGDGRLMNQQVSKVKMDKRAIGRVAKRYSYPTVNVLVNIRSTVITGDVKGSV